MNAPKRVSFGNGSSLVETLIIDDMMPADEKRFYQDTILQNKSPANSVHPTNNYIHSEEDNTNASKMAKSSEVHRVTFAESEDDTKNTNTTRTVIAEIKQTVTTSTSHGTTSHGTTSPTTSTQSQHDIASPTSPNKPAPIIKLQRTRSTESHENPFLADGELSHKADYIIKHSTISRTQLKIADPDSAQKQVVEEEIQLETVTKTEAAPVNASPDQADGQKANRPNEIKVKENGQVEEPLTPQSVEVEVAKANATQAEPQQAEEVKVKSDKKCKCCVIQ